jgi:glutamate---cysteine ligase / carboxylate-amine ligase
VTKAGVTVPSVGVEEEFLLVDTDSGEPRLVNERVADTARELGLELQLELSQCQVETNSAVCLDSRSLRDQLLSARSVAAAAALREGARLVATGTPLIGPQRMPISRSDRYHEMESRFGVLAIEQAVCGCHVHVDVQERETAVQVCNHVRSWLPTVLALGANSAVNRGIDTGFQSWRAVLWSRWPGAGPPPIFDSAADYADTVARFVDAGVLMDERMVYWDVRPSCHLPTVEIRVSDVQPTVDRTVLIATLVRALVMTAVRAVERGDDPPPVPLATLRAANWLAARDGLGGGALDPLTGRPTSARQVLDLLVEHVRDALDDLGECRWVTRRLRDLDTGASWQSRTLREVGDPARLVACAADRTLRDTRRGDPDPEDPSPIDRRGSHDPRATDCA